MVLGSTPTQRFPKAETELPGVLLHKQVASVSLTKTRSCQEIVSTLTPITVFLLNAMCSEKEGNKIVSSNKK